MKRIRGFCLWCLLLALLTGLFYLRLGPTGADGRTILALLTGDGVQTVTMADYLPLAVAGEMPAGFEMQALQAQAVAVRTFALACRKHAREGADVCADPGCCVALLTEQQLRQRWGGDYEENMARLQAAAAQTDGQYLTYGGQPIQAVFHASSLGRTEDSGALWSPLPYLVSVQSPEDPRQVPGLVTQVTVTAQELSQALGFVPAGDPSGWVEQTVPDAAGRVEALVLCGRRFTGAQVRAALGLRSTAFTLSWQDGGFLFTVSGYGHGVGMSQYGAQTYAAQGMDYRAILAHYYPGTELACLDGQLSAGLLRKNSSKSADTISSSLSS